MYVGQTIKTTDARWREHVREAKRDRGKCRLLGAAIRKHGASAFVHEVLDVVSTQTGADIAEASWIEQRRTRAPHGYNLAAGGRGRGIIHEDTSRQLSESMKRRHMDPTFRSTWLVAVTEANKKIGSEDRRARAKKGLDAMDPERRRAMYENSRLAITPEMRARAAKGAGEAVRKRYASMTQAERTAWSRKASAAKTYEQRRDAAIRANATRRLTRPREERVAAAHKQWQTKRRNAVAALLARALQLEFASWLAV